ncbi:hypothetical protein LVR06_25625, partial [Klebsiella pneumoniae]|nr:hypothetical protein [Klebsiella pneumoniae]
KRAYCLKIQPATGSFARNLIYSTKPYRVYGSGSGWTSKPGVYALKNINGLGFTERFDLSSPGLVEVRCRRRNEQGSNNARDSMFWQAL